MFKPKSMAAAIPLALGLPLGAQAQSKSDIDDLKKQVQEIKDAYENRIQGLEKRLKDAEESATVQSSPGKIEMPAQGVASRQSSQNAFNPAISLILDGTYGNFKQDPTKYAITGSHPSGPTSPAAPSFTPTESHLFVTPNTNQH